MPAFNALLSPPYTDLRQGESVFLWNNESPAAGANSIVISRGMRPGEGPSITFQGVFTSAPTATINILGSNFPPTTTPQNGTIVGSMTQQNSSLTDTNSFAFYWGNVSSVSAGEPFTLIAQG